MTPEEKRQMPERARLRESDIQITYAPSASLVRKLGAAKVLHMRHVPSGVALRWQGGVSRIRARLELERAVAAQGWRDPLSLVASGKS